MQREVYVQNLQELSKFHSLKKAFGWPCLTTWGEVSFLRVFKKRRKGTTGFVFRKSQKYLEENFWHVCVQNQKTGFYLNWNLFMAAEKISHVFKTHFVPLTGRKTSSLHLNASTFQTGSPSVLSSQVYSHLSHMTQHFMNLNLVRCLLSASVDTFSFPAETFKQTEPDSAWLLIGCPVWTASRRVSDSLYTSLLSPWQPMFVC